MDKYEIYLQQIRESTPTHYADTPMGVELSDYLNQTKFQYFSTAEWPPTLVTEVAMQFSAKYASYDKAGDLIKAELLLSQVPLAIMASTEGAADRTLIWANGAITLLADNTLIVYFSESLISLLIGENE